MVIVSAPRSDSTLLQDKWLQRNRNAACSPDPGGRSGARRSRWVPQRSGL